MPFTIKTCNFANYYPFGMQQTGTAGSYNLSSDYRYGYNGKEKDDEIKGEANSLDYGARIYDPRVGKFLSTDPLQLQFPFMSPFIYAADDPISMIDEDGKGPKPSTGATLRTGIFFITHFPTAHAIGRYSKGADNISTVSQRFAGRLGFTEEKDIAERGNEVNAFRHVLWQAEITARFGATVAKEAGDAHEGNPNALPIKSFYTNLDDADEAVDLMNNIIGRQIGKATEGLDTKFRAFVVLSHFKESGLWTATPIIEKNKVIGYSVSLTKLTVDQFDYAKTVIDGLNSKGRTSEEQDAKDKLDERKEITNNTPGF
ncbi:MAG: RHS repeat-associated core domain-containing protein [Flavobacteriales bacterium]|nr:RHS repeat-associated core domain-containing protein [Flavobacteriales bacterium]